jgi:hypothetical protein
VKACRANNCLCSREQNQVVPFDEQGYVLVVVNPLGSSMRIPAARFTALALVASIGWVPMPIAPAQAQVLGGCPPQCGQASSSQPVIKPLPKAPVACPEGQVFNGKSCQKRVIKCPKPKQLNVAGQCV